VVLGLARTQFGSKICYLDERTTPNMLKRSDIFGLILGGLHIYLVLQLMQVVETFVALQFSIQQHITLITLAVATATAFLLFRNISELITILFVDEALSLSSQKKIAHTAVFILTLVLILKLLYRL
jgi:hypothetical protein